MSPVTHDSLARGHRVREFVCTYRTLRDDQGQTVRLPTLALSDPRVAAATLAPLLAGETVEVFAVACLSTKHRLLAWYVLSRGTRARVGTAPRETIEPDARRCQNHWQLDEPMPANIVIDTSAILAVLLMNLRNRR